MMDNTPEKLTGELIQLVTKHIAQQRGEADLEAIFRSIAMACAGFAGAFHMTEKAQEIRPTGQGHSGSMRLNDTGLPFRRQS